MKTEIYISALLIVCATSSLFAQSGSISPNAKKIEFDEISPFQEGFAVMRKGTAFAIIDAKGDFFIPYGTYQQIEDGFVNGLCRVSTKGKYEMQSQGAWGFIDKSGKLVIPCIYHATGPFDKAGFALVQMPKTTNGYAFIDKKGNVIKTDYSITQYGYDVKTGRCISREAGGICDRSGKLIAPLPMNDIKMYTGFVKGLSAVLKKNEYGEEKWGFIDTNGKTVIPFQFKYQPTSFVNGFTGVTPVDKSEFSYAYMDRKGNLRVKMESTSRPPYPFFENGLTIHPDKPNLLIDTLGNIIDFGKLVKVSMPTINAEKVAVQSMDKTHIVFSYYDKYYTKQGVADRNGKVLIAPAFQRIKHFDQVSKLAWAEVSVNGKYSYGYVNEQGVFVIVKTPSGTF